MCCLFGLIDYRRNLSAKEKACLISTLAVSAEARGTDATGIAYNSGGKLHIYKRPWPAHFMRFHIPKQALAIMGHTRMTTQGKASHNYNNHPFLGRVQDLPFAMAHNGVLNNDRTLRYHLRLPGTKIRTDSYIAVQLIEQQKVLDFNSLRYMAEQVEGSFTFTALDAQNNLYIIKGDNPLCLYHFPALGLYVYASTEQILKAALFHSCLMKRKKEPVQLRCGDIIRIDISGQITWQRFDDSAFCLYPPACRSLFDSGRNSRTHLDEIKSVAAMFGYTPEDIDDLTKQGFSAEELEERLYTGEL